MLPSPSTDGTCRRSCSSPSPSSLRRCFLLLLLLSFLGPVFSAKNVTTLPGYSGTLPFTLETGYTEVGEIEFFYYFIHSQGNPGSDPVLLFMNGGPGCTGLNGLIYQIGPLNFNITDYTGGLPSLIDEENAWTKTSSIIFLDAPVGTGFTYATSTAAYSSTDTLTAQQVHAFIRKWMADHPAFQTNPFFIGTDSYAGIIAPMLAQNILQGNEALLNPLINLKGLSLSCPHTYTDLETNSKIPFAHRLTLISDALYKSVKASCGGNYVSNTSASCTEDLAEVDQCIELISRQNVLEPYCAFLSPESHEAFRQAGEKHRRALQSFTKDYMLSLSRPRNLWCKNFDYLLMDIWLSYPSVLEALGVRNGTTGTVFRCNISLSYTVDINDVVEYHKNLTDKGMQVLVFSGDHDMVIPHNGIETWIKSLALTVDFDWRPWFVDGQVAGYTVKYINSGYRLTYATIKGSGHSPPEYKRKECYQMYNRWIHYYPL
ncbi:hypothetical protein SAY87_017753 [Trapa incisa]|uniref:Serine carboxypeptidase-like 18 n=1 Tax=Trapa incisa TaxID=236973 RepID=A0AAN7L269_9MYRT|nr:hypothetical protein SAY87_017753 [Trapa incisa]